jgi:hypothetical protein
LPGELSAAGAATGESLLEIGANCRRTGSEEVDAKNPLVSYKLLILLYLVIKDSEDGHGGCSEAEF